MGRSQHLPAPSHARPSDGGSRKSPMVISAPSARSASPFSGLRTRARTGYPGVSSRRATALPRLLLPATIREPPFRKPVSF